MLGNQNCGTEVRVAPDSTGSDQFWSEGTIVQYNGRRHIVTGMGGYKKLRIWILPAGLGIRETSRMVSPSAVTKL
jgi:hypothetical protein